MARPEQELRNFFAGNPRVELIQGTLRMFRVDGSDRSTPADTDLVCILNVPSYLSAADLLNFVMQGGGGSSSHIRQLRIISDGGRPASSAGDQARDEKTASAANDSGNDEQGPENAAIKVAGSGNHDSSGGGGGRGGGGSGHYMVLLKLESSAAAAQFVNQFSGRPFTSMEPDRCAVLFVSGVEFVEGTISDQLFPADAQRVGTGSGEKLTEVPSCPVCLERLDESVGGILTILCNHSVHCECFQNWSHTAETQSVCPICRYVQHPGNELESGRPRCAVCDSDDQLWICLICGDVGCGRYNRRHALQHYQETMHSFSLELDTGRVWDYVGDAYVHRLIQNASDGKLVELPSEASRRRAAAAANAAQSSPGAGRTTANASTSPSGVGERGGSPSPPPVAAPPHEHSTPTRHVRKSPGSPLKMDDAIAEEYNYLITTQLESQRLYFAKKLDAALAKQKLAEDQLFEVATSLSNLTDATGGGAGRSTSRGGDVIDSSAAQSSPSSEHSSLSSVEPATTSGVGPAATTAADALRRNYEAQLRKLVTGRKKLQDEVRFLTEINRSMECNQAQYAEREQALQQRIAALEEENRDLLAFVSSRERVEELGQQGADVVLGKKKVSRKHRPKK